jgi:hypothetical protein
LDGNFAPSPPKALQYQNTFFPKHLETLSPHPRRTDDIPIVYTDTHPHLQPLHTSTSWISDLKAVPASLVSPAAAAVVPPWLVCSTTMKRILSPRHVRPNGAGTHHPYTISTLVCMRTPHEPHAVAAYRARKHLGSLWMLAQRRGSPDIPLLLPRPALRRGVCSETRGLKQSKTILTSPESPRRLLETNRPYTTHLSDNIVPCVRERSSDKRDFRRPDYPSGMPLWREKAETSEGRSITLKLEVTNSPSIGPRLPQQGCRQVVSSPRCPPSFEMTTPLTVASTATTAVVSVPEHENGSWQTKSELT